MKKWIVFFVLVLFVPAALAAAGGHDITSTVQSNQLAVSMLQQIFGALPPLNGNMGVMNIIVGKLNWIMFGVVGIYCGYSTSMIIYDLFQGGLQGKSQHIMMAGRLGICVALLMPQPAAGNYSTYQTIIMEVAVGGVKLANTVWHTAVGALSTGMSLDSNQTLRQTGLLHGNAAKFNPVLPFIDSNPPASANKLALTIGNIKSDFLQSGKGYQVIQNILAMDLCMQYTAKLNNKHLNYSISKGGIYFPSGVDDASPPGSSTDTIPAHGCGMFDYTKFPTDLSASPIALQGSKLAIEAVAETLDSAVQSLVSDSGSANSSVADISGSAVDQKQATQAKNCF